MERKAAGVEGGREGGGEYPQAVRVHALAFLDMCASLDSIRDLHIYIFICLCDYLHGLIRSSVGILIYYLRFPDMGNVAEEMLSTSQLCSGDCGTSGPSHTATLSRIRTVGGSSRCWVRYQTHGQPAGSFWTRCAPRNWCSAPVRWGNHRQLTLQPGTQPHTHLCGGRAVWFAGN